MLIAVQHLLAEGEERLCRHVVILQHHAFINLREGPFLREIFGGVAADIMFLIHTVYLALPVDVLIGSNLPASLDTSHVALSARSVLIEEQFGGSCLTHGLEHLSESVGSVKEQQQYGDIGLDGLFHTSSGMIKTEWIFCFSLGGISM